MNNTTTIPATEAPDGSWELPKIVLRPTPNDDIGIVELSQDLLEVPQVGEEGEMVEQVIALSLAQAILLRSDLDKLIKITL